MIPRSSPALFLRPNGNAQGGAFFMSLRTGKRLNRQEWTILPMPDYVSERVKELAKTRIEGLPILNRRRELIESADDDDDDDNNIHNSTGVNDIDPHINQTDNIDDDEDDDNDMPALGDRADDDDSDDEDDDDDDDDDDDADDDDDDEQSAGVQDDESAGVQDDESTGVPDNESAGVPDDPIIIIIII
jgi:hypothetical protein